MGAHRTPPFYINIIKNELCIFFLMGKNQTRIFYYIGLVSYMLYLLNVELIWSIPLGYGFMILSLLCLTIHLPLAILNYQGKSLIILFLVFLLSLLVGYNSQQLYLFYTSFLLVVGAKGIRFRSILKIHLFTGFILFLISFIGSKMGLIQDKVFYTDIMSERLLAGSVRHSLGYVWPTGVAIHLSFLCLSYWLLKKGKLNIVEILLFIYAFRIVFFDTDTRQAGGCILVLLLFTLLLKIMRNKDWIKVKKYFFPFILSIPFFAILSIWVTIAYDESDLMWVATDLATSGRLHLGQDAILKYGIPLLGQYFEMLGADVSAFNYNYIDSSYVQSLVLWGVVMTILLVLVYLVISFKAYKRHDMPMLLAILVAGVSGVTSQYLFQIMSCPILLALFAKHQSLSLKIKHEKRRIKEADS